MNIETEIEVEDKITEVCAWVPCVIRTEAISFCRPYINDDKKYEGTSVCFQDGTTIHIKMKYEEFIRWVPTYSCP